MFHVLWRLLTVQSMHQLSKLNLFFTQSARLLGASRQRLIWRVYLPMMTPGILAGGLLVAVDVMKELPATYLLRPFGWDTLAIQVYELSAEGLYERAAVPALIMVLFGALIMSIFQYLDKKIVKNFVSQ